MQLFFSTISQCAVENESYPRDCEVSFSKKKGITQKSVNMNSRSYGHQKVTCDEIKIRLLVTVVIVAICNYWDVTVTSHRPSVFKRMQIPSDSLKNPFKSITTVKRLII